MGGPAGPPYPVPLAEGTCATPQCTNGHLVYIIYQGIIHHTQLALSPVGIQADVAVAAKRYAEPPVPENLFCRAPALLLSAHPAP